MANLLLSKEGLLNSFTTVMIPIISGQVVPVLAKQVQMQLATELINEMQQIISCFHGTNFNELTKTGHSCLVKFKKMGLSQQDAYNAVYFIAQVYQTLQIDAKNDLADEFLDYISGYIGNKKCWVWSKPLK